MNKTMKSFINNSSNISPHEYH